MCVSLGDGKNAWKRAHGYYMACRVLPRSSYEAGRVYEIRDGGIYREDARMSAVGAVLVGAIRGGETTFHASVFLIFDKNY